MMNDTTDNDSDTENPKEEKAEAKAPLSEEFQMRVMDLLKDATQDECHFIQKQCMKHEDELNKSDVSMDDYNEVKGS